MNEGTKNLGGRPRQGITKKVSLTLTEEEWVELEAFQTVAAFIKDKLAPAPEPIPEPISEPSSRPHDNFLEQHALSKSNVEERFNIAIRFGLEKDHPYTSEMIADVKQSIYRSLFPNDAEFVNVETKTQYVCPFTHKRFGSIDKLVENAVPLLLSWKLADEQRKEQMKYVREREAAPKYFDQV